MQVNVWINLWLESQINFLEMFIFSEKNVFTFGSDILFAYSRRRANNTVNGQWSFFLHQFMSLIFNLLWIYVWQTV